MASDRERGGISASVVTVIERAKIQQINKEHRLCVGAYEDALKHAVVCGQMLSAVKADLTHGDWLPWLEDNFAGSARIAQRYMQLADAPELVNRVRDDAFDDRGCSRPDRQAEASSAVASGCRGDGRRPGGRRHAGAARRSFPRGSIRRATGRRRGTRWCGLTSIPAVVSGSSTCSTRPAASWITRAMTG